MAGAYPFRPYAARDQVNAKLKIEGRSEQLTINSFNAIVYKARLRGDRKYHRYDTVGKYHAYSPTAIDKIVDLIQHGQDYVQIAVDIYKKSLKSK